MPFISFVLFFYVTINCISFFFQGSFQFEQILYILVFIVQALVIFLIFNHRRISDITSLQIKCIWCLYVCIMLVLLFGRSYINAPVNMNIMEMFSLNPSLFFQNVFNFLFFIPLGFLFKSTSRIQAIVLKAFLIVFVIEITQLISHRGIFDITDIILNTSGIICGYFLSSIIPDRFKAKLF